MNSSAGSAESLIPHPVLSPQPGSTRRDWLLSLPCSQPNIEWKADLQSHSELVFQLKIQACALLCCCTVAQGISVRADIEQLGLGPCPALQFHPQRHWGVGPAGKALGAWLAAATTQGCCPQGRKWHSPAVCFKPDISGEN